MLENTDMKMAIHTQLSWIMTLLLLTLSVGQAAPTYKWTDEEGNVHYSQVPPEGKETQVIEPPPSVTAHPQAEEPADAPEILPPGLQPKNGEASQDLDRQKCFAARQNLEILMRNREVTMPDGKKMVLSEEMRRQKIDEAREEIKKYCGY